MAVKHLDEILQTWHVNFVLYRLWNNFDSLVEKSSMYSYKRMPKRRNGENIKAKVCESVCLLLFQTNAK